MPPPAVGKTGILLFQSQLGDTIISSCTITLGGKCKLCRKCLSRGFIQYIIVRSTSSSYVSLLPAFSHDIDASLIRTV